MSMETEFEALFVRRLVAEASTLAKCGAYATSDQKARVLALTDLATEWFGIHDQEAAFPTPRLIERGVA